MTPKNELTDNLEWRLNAIEALALSEKDTERMTGERIAEHAKVALRMLRGEDKKATAEMEEYMKRRNFHLSMLVL